MRVLAFSVLLTCIVLWTACQRDGYRAVESTPASQTPTSQNYQLPSEISLETIAERGPEGQIFLSGSTNLPDGLKVGVEIPGISWKESSKDYQGHVRLATRYSTDANMIIHGGHFRSNGFLMNKTPYPAGQSKVHFFAFFNAAGQSKEILTLIGKGGKKLEGKLFRKTDPDVIDSDLALDYVVAVTFPPLPQVPPESEAINLVKKAILTVPDLGRSSMTVQENIDFFMGASYMGISEGKGWSAKADTGNTYMVTFDYTDGPTAEESQAIWSADLVTKKVQYVNTNAKGFSWMPKNTSLARKWQQVHRR